MVQIFGSRPVRPCHDAPWVSHSDPDPLTKDIPSPLHQRSGADVKSDLARASSPSHPHPPNPNEASTKYSCAVRTTCSRSDMAHQRPMTEAPAAGILTGQFTSCSLGRLARTRFVFSLKGQLWSSSPFVPHSPSRRPSRVDHLDGRPI